MQMPSTTNSLEAMHGHMNYPTPYRNTFLKHFYAYNELTSKYTHIKERIKYNYSGIIQKT